MKVADSYERVALVIGCLVTDDSWRAKLWEAIDVARRVPDIPERKSYAAGGGAPGAAFAAEHRDSQLLQLERGAVRFCDVVSFQTEVIASEDERVEWCKRANAVLPREIRIMGRSHGLSTDFHADLSCFRRNYECLVPMSLLIRRSGGAPRVENSSELLDATGNEGTLSQRQMEQLHQDSANVSAFLAEVKERKEHRRHPKEQHDPGWGEGDEGEALLGEFHRLKLFLRKLHGNHRFHNFAAGVKLVPSEGASSRFVFRLRANTRMGQGMVAFSCAGDAMLPGQLRCMAGLAVAIQQELLPEEYLDVALGDEAIVPMPAVPEGTAYFAGSVYSKQYHWLLQPLMENQEAQAWRSWARETFLARFTTEMFQEWYRAELVPAIPAMRAAYAFATGSVPSCVGTADGGMPEVYTAVLRLLREAAASGRWPGISPGREKVIKGQTLAENGGEGGSFSVGAMPPPLSEPGGNKLFPELMLRAFELERALLPERPPSSTIAINKRAQFLPHIDSGAGAGQGRSLIVGLGDYTGGALVVEGTVHDIRYKPVEFNGWTQRHWTLPFEGERFSLVWFTPLGCEGIPGFETCRRQGLL